MPSEAFVPNVRTRNLVGSAGSTAIYLDSFGEDWLGTFDAITIPVGPSGEPGGFARDYLEFLGGHRAALAQYLRQGPVDKDSPILIDLPSPDLTGAPRDSARYAFVASSSVGATHTPQYAADAALAIARQAIRRGLSRIAIPTLGGGDAGLSPHLVAQTMVTRLLHELPQRLHSLMDISITSNGFIQPEPLTTLSLWNDVFPTLPPIELQLDHLEGGVTTLTSEYGSWSSVLALEWLRSRAGSVLGRREAYIRITPETPGPVEPLILQALGLPEQSSWPPEKLEENHLLIVDESQDTDPQRTRATGELLHALPTSQVMTLRILAPGASEYDILFDVAPSDMLHGLQQGLGGDVTYLERLLELTEHDYFGLAASKLALQLDNAGDLTQVERLPLTTLKPALRDAPKSIRPSFESDTAAGTDFLEVTQEARTFARLISAQDVRTPLSVGLFGNWGSGKTFFMKLLRREIDALTEHARASDRPQGELAYYKHIAQIEFNAWHYAEGELWASLVEHIFSSLLPPESDGPVAKKRQELFSQLGLEKTARAKVQRRVELSQEQLRDAEEKLDLKKAELFEAAKGLEALSEEDIFNSVDLNEKKILETLEACGITATTEEKAELAQRVRAADSTLRRGGQFFSALVRSQEKGRRLAWLFVSLATGPGFTFALTLLEANPLVAAGGGVATALGSVATWMKNQSAWYTKALDRLELENTRIDTLITQEREKRELALQTQAKRRDEIQSELADMEAERDRIDQRLVGLEEELERASAPQFLADFIKHRVESNDYRKYLGLVALIRQDFERLSQSIEDANAAILAGNSRSADFHLNRIVLYIDDLDRCPPAKVAEVLQAVHLFLAFPLFVVVVGVDSRWVSRSLEKEYPDMFGQARREGEEGRIPQPYAQPHDYLEKIFQIPFWLRPIGEQGIKSMVRGLVGTTYQPPTDPTQTHDVDPDEALEGQIRYVSGDALAERPENLDPEALAVHRDELEAMDSLAPLLSRSPRSLKRFVNLYRLVRAGLSEAESAQFREPRDGISDYKAVQIILALLSGPPEMARSFRKALQHKDNVGEVVLDTIASSQGLTCPDWIEDREWTDDDIERFRFWSSRVARFSF